MGEHTQLRLKPGVTLAENGTDIGLSLAGKTRWAQDAAQAALLRALICHPLDLDALGDADYHPPGKSQAPLDMAALILSFDDYLEE